MGCVSSSRTNSPCFVCPKTPKTLLTSKRDSDQDGFSRKRVIGEYIGKVGKFYRMEKKAIGEGSYGSVCRAKSKACGAIRAIKQINKQHIRAPDRFAKEIAILKTMDHPNIVKLYESFEDPHNIHLVMELCEGGELFDYIIEAGSLTEAKAACMMRQIFRAVAYMHKHQVCHRDLKPENFLLATTSTEHKTLKVVDFGTARKFEEGTPMRTKIGTAYYVAPQVVKGEYSELCDLWSCGVVMYIMLCGYPPFYGESDQQVLMAVKKGKLKFDESDWACVSEDAQALIRSLLERKQSERYDADQALNHTWIKEQAHRSSPSCFVSEDIIKKLRSFRLQNRLKQAVLQVIASQLHEEHIQVLRDIFETLDKDDDGTLTTSEIEKGLRQAGAQEIPSDFQEIIRDIDSDRSGVIDYTEFLAAMLNRLTYLQEDACWSAFRTLDLDGDGKLSPMELALAGGGKKAAAKLFREIDTDGDGNVDWEEFMTMMRAKTRDSIC